MSVAELFMWKNVCPAGRQALVCFCLSCLVFVTSFFSGKFLGYSSELWALQYWGPALYFCLFAFVLRYMYRGFAYEVSIRAAFLGAVFAIGIFLTTFNSGLRVLGLYMMCLSFFHFSEFMSVALTNPKTLTIDSFILNHSVQYAVAAVASWIEWGIEFYFFPAMKTYFWLSYIGVAMCVGGDFFRKAAMFTARTNFNHTVQMVKRPDHELVTHGVYSVCRHPSYVGWFYWSIGTQITLLNPACEVIYALASWTFFRERVYAEELTLLSFFGSQYVRYQKKVGTGLPFIYGRHLHERVYRDGSARLSPGSLHEATIIPSAYRRDSLRNGHATATESLRVRDDTLRNRCASAMIGDWRMKFDSVLSQRERGERAARTPRVATDARRCFDVLPALSHLS